MYAIIEYTNDTAKKIVSVRMSNDVVVNLQSDDTQKTKFAWCRLNEANAHIFNKLLVDVESQSIQFQSVGPGTSEVTISVPQTIEINPYARTLSEIDHSVRQAAFRSGTTSFFKNL